MTEEYKGVFDIPPPGGGLNESERLLVRLCPAILGGGYSIDLLRALPWIANQPLHYWGDLDTHGFAILSRLRQYFPHTRSFLMDCDTLLMHRDLWTEELSGTRVLRDLPTLDPHESTLRRPSQRPLGDRVPWNRRE